VNDGVLVRICRTNTPSFAIKRVMIERVAIGRDMIERVVIRCWRQGRGRLGGLRGFEIR
jgi:hypothetical protein